MNELGSPTQTGTPLRKRHTFVPKQETVKCLATLSEVPTSMPSSETSYGIYLTSMEQGCSVTGGSSSEIRGSYSATSVRIAGKLANSDGWAT